VKQANPIQNWKSKGAVDRFGRITAAIAIHGSHPSVSLRPQKKRRHGNP
jgi:hypothetical protein